MNRLPDFLVMGVPKSGTTSFHHYLRHHPGLFLPEKKEVHYFSSDALQRSVSGPGDQSAAASACRSLDAYTALFRSARPDQLIGEVSPSYFYFTECYDAIGDVLGSDVKLIVLFRNPIDRAFSNYLHLWRTGRETLGVLDALEREEERVSAGYGDFWRYKDHSRYSARLELLLSRFPREQVLLVSFHDLVADPVDVVARVCRFLGVDDSFVPPNAHRVFNTGTRTRSGRAATWLVNPSRPRALLKRAVPDSLVDRYRAARDGLLSRGGAPLPTLDDASHEHLLEAVGGEVAIMRARHALDLSVSKHVTAASEPEAV